MNRRRALHLLGAVAGVPALGVLGGRSADELFAIAARIHERLPESPAPRALTPAQYRAVTIAAEHIIPRTDTPGATDARAADFIDVMLADWYAPAERDEFLRGLADLDDRARRDQGSAFASVAEAGRLRLLTALDDEVTSLRRGDPSAANRHWFSVLKYLTVWGYCTSRVGILEGLRLDLMPGRFDGNAPYAHG